MKIKLGEAVRKVKAMFSHSYVSDAQLVTSELVKDIIASSNFQNRHVFEIYEQLYAEEPEIGGVIDRVSTLVGATYYGPTIKNPTHSPEEQKCLELANDISEKFDFPNLTEQWTEGLLTSGNVFVRKKDLFALPVSTVTLLPKELPSSLTEVLTIADKLFTDEATSDTSVEYNYKNDIYHLKYKDTPIFFEDLNGRNTFGLYSVSPLSRLVLTTWWKRQSMIIDVLWRWRMVPRLHHKLDASRFDIGKYTGTADERKAAAALDAKTTISTYIRGLNEQVPDQGFVSTGNIDIDVIEPKQKYTASNQLLIQLNEAVWRTLNIPESVVSGQASGSYASELITSSFVGIKVSSLFKKIKPVLLDILRNQIKIADSSLPYRKLDISSGFELEATKIERFRSASIMGNLGTFTLEEIRERAGYSGEVVGRLYHLPTTKPPGLKGTGDVVRDVERSDGPDEPESPWSEEAHSTSSGKTAEVTFSGHSYPYQSSRLMTYHERTGHPIIHIDEESRTYVVVRKSEGGTIRLYDYEKYMD